MTTVSIAMATYNGAAFIEEQLASFSSQERLPEELVITDDGSTDETLDIVEAFAATAPFAVRASRNPARLGYTSNFGRAVSLCRGDVILISDQDDRWDADKIALVLDVMERAPECRMTVNDQRIVDGECRDSGVTMFASLRRAGFFEGDLIMGSCTAFSRDLLPILLPFPAHPPYDSWLGAVGDALGVRRLIERPLQDFRRHETNTSDPVVLSNTSRLSVIRRYGLSDPREGWRNEAWWRRELADRLEDRERVGHLGLAATRLEAQAAAMRHHADVLDRRLALLGRKRSTRWLHALVAWRRGLYRSFGGVLSLIKDSVRP